MTTSNVNKSIVRGTTGVFEALFVEDDGTPIVPIDLSAYPAVQIVSPEEVTIQTGIAANMGDGRWKFVWLVPADAQLSTREQHWRIDWTVLTVGNRQIQFEQSFDIIDHVEASPNERAYTQIVLEGQTERLLIKFRNKQDQVQLTLRGAETITFDPLSEIHEVAQDGFYTYYADTDALSYGCFLATWRARETAISPWQTYIQQVRVPEDIFWILQPNLRMLIDKIQKKDGHVQAYSDSDMYGYMQAGADVINQADPISSWSLLNFPTAYGFSTYLIAASAWWGLQAQYISEGELAFNFCFAGDTYVLTPNGYIQIKDLVGQDLSPGLHDKEVELLTPNGVRKTKKVFVSEPTKTVKLTTKNGYEVTCTPNEPFLVLDKDLELKWVNAEDLTPDQYVAINRYSDSVDNNPDISWIPKQVCKEHYYNAWSPPILPDKVTPELGRLLGYLVSEGHVTNKDITGFTNTSDELLDDFSRCAVGVFGREALPQGSWFTRTGKCCRQISINGRIARKCLYYCGLDYVGANVKEVPWVIMQSSDDIVREFLKGFFAGDGHARDYGVFCSSSSKLLQQIQLLLIRLGFVGKRSIETISSDDYELSKLLTSAGIVLLEDGYTKRSVVYKTFTKLLDILSDDGYNIGIKGYKTEKVTVRGPSWDDYVDNVGFISEDKTNSAHKLSKRYPQRESLPPYILDFLRSFRLKYGSNGWYTCVDGVRRRLNIDWKVGSGTDFYCSHLQYKHLEKYLDNCKEELLLVDPTLVEKIERLLKYRFQFEEIVSIEADETQPTYDVCLDNEEDDIPHAFIANGFIVHNSGQTVTLDVDRTGTYEAAIGRLHDYLTNEMPKTKRNMLRRTSPGSLATRPMDFGLSSLICRVQTMNAGANQILPLMSRLGLL